MATFINEVGTPLKIHFFSSLNNSEAGGGTDTQRKPSMRTPLTDGGSVMEYSLASVDLQHFKKNLVEIIQQNKERWKELAVQGMSGLYSKLMPKEKQSGLLFQKNNTAPTLCLKITLHM